MFCRVTSVYNRVHRSDSPGSYVPPIVCSLYMSFVIAVPQGGQGGVGRREVTG